MRSCAAIAALVLLASSFAAPAFDSASWMARRDDLSDAMRLKTLHEAAEKRIAAGEATAEGIEAPVESWPDGRPKTVMTAKSGIYGQDGDIMTAVEVSVRMYSVDGKEQGRLDAKTGTFDRRTRTGWMGGGAELRFDGYTAKGDNIYFSLNDEFIKILSRPELRAKPGNLKLEKVL